MSSDPSSLPGATTGQPLSVVLLQLAQDRSRSRVSVADLLALLGDRAIGALMFIFAAPNILPVPPGVSAILGAPLLFLAAQWMLGMRPGCPNWSGSAPFRAKTLQP